MTVFGGGGPVRVEQGDDGRIWRVALAVPRGNVLDAAMVGALDATFVEAARSPRLKAVIVHGDGADFSFGASVEEHLPEHVAAMLTRFHGLFRTIAQAAVPTLAAVRGQCLGGGLELAAFAHRLVASPDARLGQPEIRLAVFAPVASVLLPERVGRGAADDLCLSGRVVSAEEALRLRLVDEVADDPVAACEDWARRYLLPHSASSLRFAVRAARHEFHRRLFAALDDLERLYLDELMATADASEGIRAFVDRRQAEWQDA